MEQLSKGVCMSHSPVLKKRMHLYIVEHASAVGDRQRIVPNEFSLTAAL